MQVFAVFDGHGGPEVARFCQLYLVSTLTQQPTWQFERRGESGGSSSSSSSDAAVEKDPAETDIGEALISAFHALDRMIDDPARR
jgi:serine/threonine protein phosphatase PrpC